VLDQKHSQDVNFDAEQASVDFNTTQRVRWAVSNWGCSTSSFLTSGQFGSRQPYGDL